MRIALIADAYSPQRTSCAVQMRDLAREFARQGHDVTIIVPAAGLREPWTIERQDGVRVLRVATLQTKDVSYARRTVAEFLLPLAMWIGFRRSPVGSLRWDAVAWYSPSIFLGPLVGMLRRSNQCRTYLILRDIFPEWAVDMGVLRKGLPYRIFKIVERYQYSVADVIGVQSPSNLAYLGDWARRAGRRLEVLHNWLADAPNVGCSISVAETPLAGRTIFVYAGNMGVAQGMDFVFDLVVAMKDRTDVGFLFVGRGSEVTRLRSRVDAVGAGNVLFHSEIDSAEMPGLLAQCHIGLVTLDPRHRTHNVPGKFLAYMQAGLPVLARINPGNDLAALIESRNVGLVYVGEELAMFQKLAATLCGAPPSLLAMSRNARSLAKDAFAVSSAVQQISGALLPS